MNKEIEFIKDLEAIIGKGEGTMLISRHCCEALQNFLPFRTFAMAVCGPEKRQIFLWPGGSVNEAGYDFVISVLTTHLPDSCDGDGPDRVSILGEIGTEPFDPLVYRSTVAPLCSQGKMLGAVAIFRDSPFQEPEEVLFHRLCSHIALTLEKIQLFDKVTDLAIKDGLTGIFNHLHIVTKLEQEVARSGRYGSNLSVILFDIDNFKDVNDVFGHLAGDQVLTRVAELLKTSVRNIDMVGRYGGEEFLAVLPETDAEAAVTMAERLRGTIENERFVYDDKTIQVTVCGGVAGYQSGMDANGLIKTADEGLLRAKRQGKNLVIYEGR